MQPSPATAARPPARFTACPLFRAARPMARTPRLRPLLLAASGSLVLQWPGLQATGAADQGQRRL
ncbi:MAG: hypothetical protein Q8K45_22245 [Rubrivivax sp.]|nr:hypothetical protein [Rubrivivax sp.]